LCNKFSAPFAVHSQAAAATHPHSPFAINSRHFPASNADTTLVKTKSNMLHANPQVSSSAYAAARDYWPDLFSSIDAAQQQQVMEGLRSTRPVLVRGYESMVMARMLLEDPVCVDAILADWHPLLHKTLDR
jgi:hypothetical protein